MLYLRLSFFFKCAYGYFSFPVTNNHYNKNILKNHDLFWFKKLYYYNQLLLNMDFEILDWYIFTNFTVTGKHLVITSWNAGLLKSC